MINNPLPHIKASVSILDSALDVKYFLLLGSLILFFEDTDLIYYNRDIFTFIKSTSSLSWIEGILILAMFFFFVAILIPPIRGLISWSTYRIGFYPNHKIITKDMEYSSSLEKEGLETQNFFIQEVLENHKKKAEEVGKYQNIVFSFNILFVINFTNSSSISRYLFNLLFSQSGIKLLIAWVSILVFILFFGINLWESLRFDDGRIYFPRSNSRPSQS